MTKSRVAYSLVTVFWIMAPVGAEAERTRANQHQFQPGIPVNRIRHKLHGSLFPDDQRGNVRHAD
jgi:hypothetical protein